MKKTFDVLMLSGDGIGVEVMAQVEKIIALFNKNEKLNINFNVKKALIGGVAIDSEGVPVSDETLSVAKSCNFTLLGAVGGPKWDGLSTDKRPEAGLLKIRKFLNLYANLRPIVVFDELVEASPLKSEYIKGLDLMIVRELVGGLYFGEPKGVRTLENGEKYGYNTLAYKESEIERILAVAFEIAQKRNKKVCSVDKANVLASMKLWRDVAIETHKKYSNVELTHIYVDAMAMELIKAPKKYDVVVTENMFGDILSDLASQLTGSIGMLSSASLGKLDGKDMALYEPVHGSAPDIMGKNLANPIAMVMSLAMALKYSCNEPVLADKIENAIKCVLKGGFRTGDIKSPSTPQNQILGTNEMGDKICHELASVL